MGITPLPAGASRLELDLLGWMTSYTHSGGAHKSTYARVSGVFLYADDEQVGDSARGREIRRSLHVTAVCRAHSQGITHDDGMDSDRDRSLLSEKPRYYSNKEQCKGGASICLISEAAGKVSSTETKRKEILVVSHCTFILCSV